ncbi:MAG: glycerophosphodiester phosphodiesterase [Noviherbaspirillum sp.]
MWPFPRVIAHRGGGTLAPENTIAGLRCGLEHGFRAAEFDVMLSADGVPVLMHDPAFGRTVQGTGNVSETSAKLLATMDAGSWFAPRFAGEPVPSFADAIGFCSREGIWMNAEIKPSPGYAAETGRAAAALLKQMLAEDSAMAMPLFSSFSPEALLAAREIAPGIPRGLLIGHVPQDWQARLEQVGAVALHTNHKNLSEAQARAIKDAGFGLFCYTVDDPEIAQRLLDWGVDAFCTDRLDLIPADFAAHRG